MLAYHEWYWFTWSTSQTAKRRQSNTHIFRPGGFQNCLLTWLSLHYVCVTKLTDFFFSFIKRWQFPLQKMFKERCWWNLSGIFKTRFENYTVCVWVTAYLCFTCRHGGNVLRSFFHWTPNSCEMFTNLTLKTAQRLAERHVSAVGRKRLDLLSTQ